MRPLSYAAQVVIYLGFAALMGYFSNAPAYRHFPDDQAMIKLAFAHGAKPKGACHRLTREELQALAPNMRKPTACPRERWPVDVELRVDGALIYAASLPPSGLSGDGPSRAYERITVPTGRHEIDVRLRDGGPEAAFEHQHRQVMDLTSRRNLVIDFRSGMGGFVLH